MYIFDHWEICCHVSYYAIVTRLFDFVWHTKYHVCQLILKYSDEAITWDPLSLYWPFVVKIMMTSSTWNIFRVTGPLCGEFTGHRWIPRTKASDAELCFVVFFDLRLNKRLNKQSWGWWFETPSRPLWRHCNVPGLDSCNRWSTMRICGLLIAVRGTMCWTKFVPHIVPLTAMWLSIFNNVLCVYVADGVLLAF